MRNRLLGAIAGLLAGAGFTVAQPLSTGPLPPSPYAYAAAPPAPANASQDAPPEGPATAAPAPTAATSPPVPSDAAPVPTAADMFRPTQETSAYPFFFWAKGEYLLWTIKKGPQPPPLLTTGPATADNPAVLTDPTTVVLFPTGPIDYHEFQGGRWAIGSWFDPCQSFGAEVTGLVLVRRSPTVTATSDAGGSPVLGVPFIDAQSGTAVVNYASFPGRFAGGVAIASASSLWGMEVNFYGNWSKSTIQRDGRPLAFGDLQIDWLGGFRYLSLTESLDLTQPSTVLPAGATDFNGMPVAVGDEVVIRDGFGVRSQFFGGQLGCRAEFDHGPFYVEFLGKAAIGESHETLRINGDTTLIPAATGIPAAVAGGFFATATNIGRTTHERFAVVPEVGINVGYQPAPLVRLFVGYTFLYWSEVLRAGNQIDPTVNLTAVPSSAVFGTPTGPARPAPLFRTTDFWAQGVSFGFEVRY